MIPAVKASLPKVVDSTIVAEYTNCHTKGYYSFQRNLGSLLPSVDLVCGGAFAKGLEVFRKEFYGLGPLHHRLSSALEKGMLAAIAEYGNIQVPESKIQKGVDRVVTALAAYVEKFPPLTDHIQPYFVGDHPLVEFTFSIPLPIAHPESGEPFIYAGRFDMLGMYNGQLVVVDEKTTSQLGATWKNKWNLRGQFTGYCWAAREYGRPVIGAVARGISFLKHSHGFEESFQQRPPFMIDAWYQQLLVNVSHMVSAWEHNWYDQAFDDACVDYSGCPFQTLCTSPDPETWIPGRYSQRIWNPLDKVPAKQPEQQIETVAAPVELQQLFKE